MFSNPVISSVRGEGPARCTLKYVVCTSEVHAGLSRSRHIGRASTPQKQISVVWLEPSCCRPRDAACQLHARLAQLACTLADRGSNKRLIAQCISRTSVDGGYLTRESVREVSAQSREYQSERRYPILRSWFVAE